ncbi:Tim44/TimA family putative adaptor protein [Pseudohoeflea coraliihabitans]|uniref:Tim44/TimA family putative adaptor protein n=1 Tax=Pseudohoeflea coraliihabitans TaxID=2860393 RepID=A0ABS6WT55_9HYPH|nr:Tim44/TimA family putative adaptor protein [Pseudohoeflea sp. DP4N28-3]MBW3099130.1 Tim44/TimA family putative adaptor protein [Pseudohoeflea sp. DP4N28-3]
MGSFDIVTVIFFIAAVVIFIQLRSVLGRKDDSDQSRIERKRARRVPTQAPPLPSDDPKVVTLPSLNKDSETAVDDMAAIDTYATPGTELNDGLRALKAADPSFDPKEFVKGAGIAYEMIVAAYAEGDRKTLRSLLSRDVYEGFAAAIEERERRGETARSNFVGIEKTDIIQVEMKGSEANVTVRIISQLISATFDSDGKVIEGDTEEVSEVNDVWTFARDTRSRDPNWRLIATEADQ